MSTPNRPEISKQSPYWISRHRFYELKHFCLQYYEWKNELQFITECHRHPLDGKDFSSHNIRHTDPVFECVIRREELTKNIDIIDKAAKACSDDIGEYVFRGVTEGVSFEYLFTAEDRIPCCKDYYYEAFRRFFWILSKLRK